MLRDILFPRCFVDVFPQLKHWLSMRWGMRLSVMFIRVKTSSTEEGMIAFTRLHKSAARHGSHTGTGADCGCSSQCLCWVYTRLPARFWTVPEVALQCVYTLICHATSKTVKTDFLFILIFSEKKIYILYSFGTHAYRSERPVPKRFGTNMCTVTPLVNVNIKTTKRMCRNLNTIYS